MLDGVQNLTKQREYSYVMSWNLRIVSRSFVIFFRFINCNCDYCSNLRYEKKTESNIISQRESDVFSVGIIASKKVGNAVKRNRCKRVLRVATRSVARTLSRRTNLALVLIARSSLVGKKSQCIEEELRLQLGDILRRTCDNANKYEYRYNKYRAKK